MTDAGTLQYQQLVDTLLDPVKASIGIAGVIEWVHVNKPGGLQSGSKWVAAVVLAFLAPAAGVALMVANGSLQLDWQVILYAAQAMLNVGGSKAFHDLVLAQSGPVQKHLQVKREARRALKPPRGQSTPPATPAS